MRNHALELGLFGKDGSLLDVLKVTLDPKTPVQMVKYDNTNDIAGVLPNYNDLSFIRVQLDETSLNFFIEKLCFPKTKSLELDTLNLLLLWNTLYQMV